MQRIAARRCPREPLPPPATTYDVDNYPNQPDVAPDPSNSIGFGVSEDGIHWHQGGALVVQTRPETNWSSDARTPMGLV